MVIRTNLRVKVNRIPRVMKNLDPVTRGEQVRTSREIAAAARRYVHVRTGALQGTIRVDNRGDTVVVIAGSAKVTWGPFNEYGTIHMAAIPFMRPAVDEVMDTYRAPNLEAELLR